jgi:hypothetical protein
VSFSTRPHVIGRRVKYWMCCVLALCCIHGAILPAIAQANEKLTSPDAAQGGTGPATSSAMASPQTPRATQAVSLQQHDFEAAKQEYEQSPHDETARLTYVTKLAQIADPLVAEYRQSGRRHDEVMTVINSEWKKHPAPRDIDSKKLRQLLVGKWDSPRRTYVFRADGKTGAEDGPISGNWRIDGNQLIQGDSSGTIILLNDDYFIYAGDHDAVFFHTRVKE